MSSRTEKSTLNSLIGLLCCVISSVLSFFLRGAFIRFLGTEYAGINSIFSDILKLLNLVDLGVSNAILVRLYASCANKDNEETELYLVTYRKICYLLATLITIGGIICTPFLRYLVKEQPSFSEPLWLLFIIVIATSFIEHAWCYKTTIFIAKQDRFISTLIQYICLFLQHGLQLLVLVLYKNIYLFLLVPFITLSLRYTIADIIGRKRYKIKYKSSKCLSNNDKKELFKDVGSLGIYKLCRTLDFTVDTMLIGKFVSVAVTGIYGSINMLFGALHELLGVFNDGIIASVGDLYVRGDKEQLESVFYQAFHLTYLIYGISAVVLSPFVSDFAMIWIGHTLPNICIYIIIINFLVYGFGMHISTFRNSTGVFRQGWGRPAVTAFLNVLFSVILVQKIGLLGAILGTTLARILTQTWYDPYVVFRYRLNHGPWKYYLRFVIYCIIIFISSYLLIQLRLILPPMKNIVYSIFYGLIYLCIASLILLTLGMFFSEQKVIYIRIKELIKKKISSNVN